MVYLLYAAIGKTDGDTIVAQIVLEIVVIDGLMCGVIECNVASIDEYHTERVADIYAVACIFAPGMDQQRTVTGCTQIIIGQTAGIRVEIIIYALLHSVGSIGIVYVAAVNVVYPAWHIERIVTDARNPAVCIAGHVAIGVIGTFCIKVGSVCIIHGILVSRSVGCMIGDPYQSVAVILICEVIGDAIYLIINLAAATQGKDVAHQVVAVLRDISV